MSDYVNLMDKLTEGLALPEGCDAWGIRSVFPDFRSSRDFRWPFPGNWAEASGPFIEQNTDGCPNHVGDGICLATSWAGMASGPIPAITLLLCAYSSDDVLGRTASEQKFRLRRALVVDVIDGAKLIRQNGNGADLNGANLYGADLYSANLTGANLNGASLYGADLYGASLDRANLYGASLNGANLTGANLNGANLTGASLYGANLNGANLTGASLYGANLYSANLNGANLTGANLNGADLYGASLYGAIGIEVKK